MRTRINIATILLALVFFSPAAQAEDDYTRIAAAHEAGHAGLALMHPELFRLKYVHIVSNDADGTGGKTSIESFVRSGDDRDRVIELMAQQLAGAAAEKLLLNNAVLGGDVNDLSQAIWLGRQLLGADADIQQALAEAKVLARQELEAHRPQVQRLADALRAKIRLTGAEASAIWDQN